MNAPTPVGNLVSKYAVLSLSPHDNFDPLFPTSRGRSPFFSAGNLIPHLYREYKAVR